MKYYWLSLVAAIFLVWHDKSDGVERPMPRSSKKSGSLTPVTDFRLISARQKKSVRSTARPPSRRPRTATSVATPATGSTLFFNSAATTPLSSTPAPSGKQVLSADDFQFLGTAKLPTGIGWCFGLTYRRSTRTFFSIGKEGSPPYRLVEYVLPEPLLGDKARRASLAKDWGPLDPDRTLEPVQGMLRMEGLYWEEEAGRLWLSWGNYYNAGHTNDPCLAYATLEPLELHGPWHVPAAVHSETCRGQIKPAPDALSAITHAPWTMFGGRGNTAQRQTWGTGLVAVADPGEAPAGAEVSAMTLVHWPMVGEEFIDPRRPSETMNHYYSAFPRMEGDVCRNIAGNNDVNLPDKHSYEYNVLIDDNAHYQAADGIFHSAWIETRSREGLFYCGRVGIGYCWYGNPKAHADGSAEGIKWENNLESLVRPGTSCVSQSGNRGRHAERWSNRAYFVNPQDILAAARLAMAGRLPPAAAQVPPTSIADLGKLGGDVPDAPTLSDCYWNADDRRLYLLAPGLGGGGGTVLVWSVRD